jgi:hypothetical protein
MHRTVHASRWCLIGFCARGYYGTARCEFEVGNRVLEVVGPRELLFFPGLVEAAPSRALCLIVKPVPRPWNSKFIGRRSKVA